MNNRHSSFGPGTQSMEVSSMTRTWRPRHRNVSTFSVLQSGPEERGKSPLWPSLRVREAMRKESSKVWGFLLRVLEVYPEPGVNWSRLSPSSLGTDVRSITLSRGVVKKTLSTVRSLELGLSTMVTPARVFTASRAALMVANIKSFEFATEVNENVANGAGSLTLRIFVV